MGITIKLREIKWIDESYKLCALFGSSRYRFKFDLCYGGESANEDLSLSSRVILKMLQCVKNHASRCVYFDNFFTTRDLLLHLQKMRRLLIILG